MPNIISSSFTWLRNLNRRTMVIGVILIVLLGIGGYFLFWPKNKVYQFVSVQRKSIIETVSVTGNTTPVSSVSLGFGSSGNIARIYSSVGRNVTQGQVLASLNASDLYAQIKQAQANVDTQQANYQKVINGATRPVIDAARASLNTAQVILDEDTKKQSILVENAYRSLLNSTIAAESTTDTTLTAPTITGVYTKTEKGTITISVHEVPSGEWFSLAGLATGTGQVSASIPQPLSDTGLYIQFPNSTGYDSTTWTIEIPNTAASNYLSNYNAYQQTLQTQSQTLASDQSAINQAQANLAETSSPARPEDVASAQAQVENAQAALQSVEAKLQNSEIIAPISGIITQFDARVGEFASPGTTLVSIISGNSFEIDTLVSETDIGKVSVNNKVTMTLDAFPGEIFTGSVFYIDPAQTTNQGVVGYKIKIAFDKADSHMKSGLTANISIETRQKDNVLVLPQYAILQNDQGTFIEVLQNGKVKNIPVTLGLQDQNGNVEIVSGVTENQQVLNIGLK